VEQCLCVAAEVFEDFGQTHLGGWGMDSVVVEEGGMESVVL
jgi:hypothetical protein